MTVPTGVAAELPVCASVKLTSFSQGALVDFLLAHNRQYEPLL